jgi:3-methyladenine DNA glycosylase AlkD
MIQDDIREELFRMQDLKYRDFQVRLIPTVNADRVIGVRTPMLRKYARQISIREDIEAFLSDLPHKYFDEDQLHAFILGAMKDYGRCINEVNRFLPYINNWATCDQLAPGIFKKHRQELQDNIKIWLRSDHAYTVRFGIGMLMQHFLDEAFDSEYLDTVAGIRSREYYVNMMVAWFFATALAKQYDAAVRVIEDRRLDGWTHNKTIQKALESYRITPERKAYLRSLKVRRQKYPEDKLIMQDPRSADQHD